jgi:hypothetical protein
MGFAPKAETERKAVTQKARAAMKWEDERIRFFSHANRQILFVDFSHCSAVQVEKIARAVPEYVTKQPVGSVLLLSDFAGATMDREAIRTMKESAVFDKPYVKKSAFIGAENFPSAFYDELKAFAGRELPMFRTRTEALDWLAHE